MAKEGSVAPKERINITFKPAIGGAQEEVELPLKLLVLGDFTQREDVRKLEDRKPIAIDKNTLDEVLANQALNLTLNVPNRLQEGADAEELGIQVRINSMKDFNPAHLVEQIPQLQKLMALREAQGAFGQHTKLSQGHRASPDQRRIPRAGTGGAGPERPIRLTYLSKRTLTP
jgi:type VI secretion system protein ImpB